MRRRALLRTAAALTATATVGAATTGADPDDYAPLGSVEVEGATDAAVGDDGRTVYLAVDDGFATVDVSDPTSPSVLAEVRGIGADRQGGPLDTIFDASVDGDRLLVAGPAHPPSRDETALFGIGLYDVSDPADPVPDPGVHPTEFWIHNCFLHDGYAYLPNNADPAQSLTILDVSGVPEEVARWSPLDHDPGVEGWSDLEYLPGGLLHDVYVQDGMAYCPYWDAGTWFVDVSDPTDPEYVGRIGDWELDRLVELADDLARLNEMALETPGNDHYAAVDESGSLMAVGDEAWDVPDVDMDGPGGIALWDISDPADPERLSTIDPEPADDESREGTWTTAHNFEVRNDRLYSSWYEAGVKVHDVSDPTDPQLLAWWRRPDEAMFWTARVAAPGEFFVASSTDRRDHRPAVYTFPDRAGRQADPPDQFPVQKGSIPATPTPTPTETPGPATPTGTPTDGTRNDGTPTGEDGENAPLPTPGFGVGVTLAGIGAGAYRYLSRGGSENETEQ